MGQLRPGDFVRFVPISYEAAVQLCNDIQSSVECLEAMHNKDISSLRSMGACILNSLPGDGHRPPVIYRQAGDSYILVEYGDMELNLAYRVRVHSLSESIYQKSIEGIIELSPGVRSLQIQFDATKLDRSDLIAFLVEIEGHLPAADSVEVPCRVVELPLAFEDSATLDAVSRYRDTVRATAPWLPNNVEFIRRINGLESREQVRSTVASATYLVLGLGDVYLGAPCAVPLDPRHRLVTSKYNPARTYTAEGTVGIGGVYMCIYGMDSPGGYQLIGRTIPIWSRDRQNPEPWLLKNFDKVSFYLVSEDELLRMRKMKDYASVIRIRASTFKISEYAELIDQNAESIDLFKAGQQRAFKDEVRLWDSFSTTELSPEPFEDFSSIRDDHIPILAASYGCVWKVLVKAGDVVDEGQDVVVLEAMKMESKVVSPTRGLVQGVVCVIGKVYVRSFE